MKEEKNIPFRNYIFLAIVLLLSVVMVIYFYMWYGEFENNKFNTPLIDQYLSVIKSNELDDYLIENKDVIIYASALDDEETREFEKRFKNVIYNYLLNNNMLYLNLTDEKKDKNIYNKIKDRYYFDNLPCILIFKDGKIYDVYSIKNNNYDINNLIIYLKTEGVIND